MAVACLGSIALVSCSKDDDNNGSSAKTTTLKFSKSSVSVGVGKVDTLKVANGTQPFTAKSTAEKVATVKTKKDSIFVTGVKAGTATIVVTDSKKGTGSLTATVK